MIANLTLQQAQNTADVVAIQPQGDGLYTAYQRGDVLPALCEQPAPPTADDHEAIIKDFFTRAPDRMIRLLKAKCISDLAFRLGKLPGQVTSAELIAERDRISQIYRNL